MIFQPLRSSCSFLALKQEQAGQSRRHSQAVGEPYFAKRNTALVLLSYLCRGKAVAKAARDCFHLLWHKQSHAKQPACFKNEQIEKILLNRRGFSLLGLGNGWDFSARIADHTLSSAEFVLFSEKQPTPARATAFPQGFGSIHKKLSRNPNHTPQSQSLHTHHPLGKHRAVVLPCEQHRRQNTAARNCPCSLSPHTALQKPLNFSHKSFDPRPHKINETAIRKQRIAERISRIGHSIFYTGVRKPTKSKDRGSPCHFSVSKLIIVKSQQLFLWLEFVRQGDSSSV